jgi:NADH:ubiquinone oxidoreductase subunit
MLSRLRSIVFPTWPRLVGRDLSGNTYYLVKDTRSSPDKRIIKYKSEFPEPETVPMVWYAWLRYARPIPPTIEEINAENQNRDEILRRAALLKEADEKLRQQEVAEKRLKQRETGENEHI